MKNNAALVPVTGSPFTDALGDSESLALSSKPLLFSLDFDNGEVQAFRRNQNGSLTALGGVQDTGLHGLNGVGAFDPKGRFLVLADDANNQVASFSVNKNTGVITPMDTERAPARRTSTPWSSPGRNGGSGGPDSLSSLRRDRAGTAGVSPGGPRG